MELAQDDPRSVGPWRLESVNFREAQRTSYSARINSMSADILVLKSPKHARPGMRLNLDNSKTVSSLEIAKVLDVSLASSPPWMACDQVPGTRLSEYLLTHGHLTPSLWAELARTALIGCAALRSASIKGFQISTNTFVINGDEIHMVDVWAAEFESSELYPATGGELTDLSAADDKFAIGRLLTLAMGADIPGDSETITAAASNGFDDSHLVFMRSLTTDVPTQRPSTEGALRAIPGRNPAWTVPVFALDKPGRQRAKRQAQKGLLRALIAAAGLAGLVGLFLWLGAGSDSNEATQVATPDDNVAPEPVLELKLSFTNENIEPQIFTNPQQYTFTYCFPEANLRIEEIPDRLVFQQLMNGEWQTDPDVRVRVVPSVECPDGESAVTFTTQVPSRGYLTDSWTPCRDFRVLVPRLSSEKRAPIRFCLQQREVAPDATQS